MHLENFRTDLELRATLERARVDALTAWVSALIRVHPDPVGLADVAAKIPMPAQPKDGPSEYEEAYRKAFRRLFKLANDAEHRG